MTHGCSVAFARRGPGIHFVILWTLVVCCAGSSSVRAAEYDIRNFESAAHIFRRTGPDLVPLLDSPGDRFFMGAHVRLDAQVPDEPSALLTISASTVGSKRYIRLQSADTSRELEVQVRTEGGSGPGLNLSVGSPLAFGQWYAVGVLAEAGQSEWNFTIYVQPHGGNLQTATDSTPLLSFPTLDLYSVARHAFVSSTGGATAAAHNLLGDAVSPVFVYDPTTAEIASFLALEDPSVVWSAGDYLARPDLDSLVDAVDQVEWDIKDAGDTSITGTLFLPEPEAGALALAALVTVGSLGRLRRASRH